MAGCQTKEVLFLSLPAAQGRSGVFLSKRDFKKKSHLNSGQALLEYVLLLSLVAAIAIGFRSSFGVFMSTGITRFNAQLEKELTSAGFAEAKSLWEN